MRALYFKITFTLTVIFGLFFLLSINFASAQNSWTPPSGPPLGNNVPAPVNIGDTSQSKSGSLGIGQDFSVQGDTNLYGQTKVWNSFFETKDGNVTLNDTYNSSPQYFASFLNSAGFYGNNVFQVGTSNGLGGSPLISLAGRLRLFPRLPDGSADAQNAPQQGYVLTALDAQGNAGWRPATGGGGGSNQPVINIEDEGSIIMAAPEFINFVGDNVTVTDEGNNRVKVEVLPGTGELPACGNDGEIAIFNEGLQVWECGLPSSFSMPPGNQGETLAYNGTDWESTNKVFHDQYSLPFPFGTPRTSLINDRVELNSPDVYLGQSNNGVTRVASPSFLVGNDSVATNAIFYSDSLKFRGTSPLATSALAPGKGRIAYSTDDEGSFKWNQYFRYDEDAVTIPIPPFNLPINVLRLQNNPDTLATLFVNDGMTILQDDLTVNGKSTFNDDVLVNAELKVSGDDLIVDNGGNIRLNDEGDLYLEGITGSIDLANQEELCINMNTKRVHVCKTTAQLEQIGGGDGRGHVYYFPDDNDENLVFNAQDTVDIEFCAGGSGGGGGGIGNTATGGGPGNGGGGGGGGAQGGCQTLNNVNFNAGDVLSWEIGEGGPGGDGAYYSFSTQGGTTTLSPALPGFAGQSTKIFKNGVQLGQTQLSDAGGLKGESMFENTSPSSAPDGGDGAVSSLPDWWHDGADGYITGANNCASCGGKGGHGQSPAGENASVSTGSRGGGGGAWSQNGITKYGGNGLDGKLAAGGGGGGGGYGDVHGIGVPPIMTYILKGGNGGNGGPGYVKISNLDQSIGGGINEQVYTTPGTYTFSLQSLPDTADNLRIGIWAGGGAGGPAHYDGGTQPTPTINGGGGGSGEYVLLDLSNNPQVNTCIANNQNCQIQVTVGAGGQPGQSNTSPGAVQLSTGGSSSSVSLTAGGPLTITAAPGQAGQPNSYNTSNGWNGAGGAGGGSSGFTNYGGGYSVTRTAGVAGQSASQGGLGANQNGGSGLGGNGVVISDSQAANQVNISAAGSGSSGKVRIFWEE